MEAYYIPYLKDNYPMSYSTAKENPKALYFDERYWSPKDIKIFFEDLQVCDVHTWERNHFKLTKQARYSAVNKRIKLWLKNQSV